MKRLLRLSLCGFAFGAFCQPGALLAALCAPHPCCETKKVQFEEKECCAAKALPASRLSLAAASFTAAFSPLPAVEPLSRFAVASSEDSVRAERLARRALPIRGPPAA